MPTLILSRLCSVLGGCCLWIIGVERPALQRTQAECGCVVGPVFDGRGEYVDSNAPGDCGCDWCIGASEVYAGEDWYLLDGETLEAMDTLEGFDSTHEEAYNVLAGTGKLDDLAFHMLATMSLVHNVERRDCDFNPCP